MSKFPESRFPGQFDIWVPPLRNRRFTLSCLFVVVAGLRCWCCCFVDYAVPRTVQQPPVVASAGRVRDAGALEQLPAHLRQLPQASLLLPGRQRRTAAVVEHNQRDTQQREEVIPLFFFFALRPQQRPTSEGGLRRRSFARFPAAGPLVDDLVETLARGALLLGLALCRLVVQLCKIIHK